MTDFRLKKVEMTIALHNRRLDDHDSLHAQNAMWRDNADKMINLMRENITAHNSTIEVVTEVLDALKQLLRYFRWIGVVAKWIIAVGAAFTTCWLMIKYVVGYIIRALQ